MTLNGWREAENGSHVAEIDARRWSWRTRIISWPCTFGMCSADANQMKHLLNSTRRCWMTHFCWGNWKITRAGKTSRKNCCVVLWHGRTGSKMRWAVLWIGKKLEQLHKDSSPSSLGCKHHTYLYARRRTFVSCAPHSARFMQPNPTPKHRIWAQLLQLPERRATPINLRDSFPCRNDATIISAAEDPEVPHSGASRSSKQTAASRLPTMLGSLGASLWKQRPDSVDSRASIQALNVDRECVVSTVFSSHFKGKDRDQNVVHSSTDRNLQTTLDPKVDSAVRGERMAQPKLYEADAEVEAGNWHRFSWDQSRIWISTISATWADQAQRTKSACMENWNWQIDSSKTIMQDIAKKLKNWEELVAKKQIEQDKQELMNCLCIKTTTVSQFLTQIQDLQNKVNSLTDAREFYNPESGISSGATHVPDQTSTILSPRTLPRCDSGMPRDTQCGTGITGNVFERPRAEEGHSSTICKNSKNLASSSQGLRPDTTGIARKRDDDMKREPLNTSVPSPHFESGSGMLNHTGGTSSHNGMMDYPRVPISELHLGKIPDSMKVQSWKVNQLQDWSLFEKHILLSQCSGSKKLRLQNQLMNFWYRDRLWSTISMISICLMRWLRLHWGRASQHADTFPKESVEEQRA